MMYKKILCGGTFDRFHDGHKAFLSFAFSKGENVVIGITSDRFVSHYKKDKRILPFLQRKQAVEGFLRVQHLLPRATIIAIDEPFDATQENEDAKTALLVSSETYANGQEINKLRMTHHKSVLPLIVFPVLLGQHGNRISSTDIREGILDTTGELVFTEKVFPGTLFVPNNLRDFLHKPFGTLITGEIPSEVLQTPKRIITVGDVTTKRVHQLGIIPKLAIVDFSVERRKTHETLAQLGFAGDEEILAMSNAAGQVHEDIWKNLKRIDKKLSIEKNFLIIINGEEDLLVIPLILMLPTGYTLLYGQPGEGIVVVEITNEVKQHAYNLLTLFQER